MVVLTISNELFLKKTYFLLKKICHLKCLLPGMQFGILLVSVPQDKVAVAPGSEAGIK